MMPIKELVMHGCCSVCGCGTAAGDDDGDSGQTIWSKNEVVTVPPHLLIFN